MQRFFPELRLFLAPMKRSILYPMILLLAISTNAQSYNSWKVYHNRREVSEFNDKKEPTDERRVVLLNRLLDGPGFFIIEFTPMKDQADWIRTIGFYNAADSSIREYNNTLFLRLHNSEIAGIMDGRQGVKVYSWAIPKDPNVAATIRVRRELLCTLYTR